MAAAAEVRATATRMTTTPAAAMLRECTGRHDGCHGEGAEEQ
jgi:hypothetical protein